MITMSTPARRSPRLVGLSTLCVSALLGAGIALAVGVGTATGAAATPAADPPCTETGTIAVTSATGAPLGRIARAQSLGAYTVTKTGTPLSVTATVGTQGDLIALNSSGSLPDVGASVGDEDDTLAEGSPSYTFLDGVTPTAPGDTPEDGDDTQTGISPPNEVESAIWTLDADNSLTPTWVNPNGLDAPTIVYYDETEDYLGLTGDLDTFSGEFSSETAVAVTLTFQPTTPSTSPACTSGGAPATLPEAPYAALLALTALPAGAYVLRRRRTRDLAG